MVGRLWSSAELALEQLPEGEAHKSTIGASLADDVKEAVIASTQTLWQEIKPKVTPASGVDVNRLTSFEKSYKASLDRMKSRGAIIRATRVFREFAMFSRFRSCRNPWLLQPARPVVERGVGGCASRSTSRPVP